MNVSIIIPYKNEEENIIYTAKKILEQNYKKYEVIFVNSNSNDSSFKLLDNFIYKKKLKNFRNISKNTLYPSDSKNEGIKLSKYEYISFMDCGLKFDKNWLNKQVKFLKKNKQNIVLGNLFSSASQSFDKAVISQTWGLNRLINVVPGTLIKKNLLKKIGYFKVLRAGYDRAWILNVKQKFKVLDNKQNILKYRDKSGSSDLIKLFNKIYLYSYHSSEIFKKKKFIYLIVFLIFLFSSVYIHLINSILVYTILRLLFPFLKSKKIYDLCNLRTFLFLIPVGFIIDFARILAFYKSLVKSI